MYAGPTVTTPMRNAALLQRAIQSSQRGNLLELNIRMHSIAQLDPEIFLLGTKGDCVFWELKSRALGAGSCSDHFDSAANAANTGHVERTESRENTLHSESTGAEDSASGPSGTGLSQTQSAQPAITSSVFQVYQEGFPSWLKHAMTIALTRHGNQRAIKQNPLEEAHYHFAKEPVTCLQIHYLPDQSNQINQSNQTAHTTDYTDYSHYTHQPNIDNSLDPRLSAQLIGTGDADGNIIVWKYRALKKQAHLKQVETLYKYRYAFHGLHEEHVSAIKFSFSMSRMYSTASDRTLCVVDLLNNSILHKVNTQFQVAELRVTPLFETDTDTDNEYSNANVNEDSNAEGLDERRSASGSETERAAGLPTGQTVQRTARSAQSEPAVQRAAQYTRPSAAPEPRDLVLALCRLAGQTKSLLFRF